MKFPIGTENKQYGSCNVRPLFRKSSFHLAVELVKIFQLCDIQFFYNLTIVIFAGNDSYLPEELGLDVGAKTTRGV